MQSRSAGFLQESAGELIFMPFITKEKNHPYGWFFLELMAGLEPATC